MRDAVGFTLMEVLVVVTLLGLMAGMTGLAIASLDPSPKSKVLADLRRARAEAIRTGRAIEVPGGQLFLPDGSARGTGLDLLTGTPHAEP